VRSKQQQQLEQSAVLLILILHQSRKVIIRGELHLAHLRERREGVQPSQLLLLLM
jgi:hypothetical protein